MEKTFLQVIEAALAEAYKSHPLCNCGLSSPSRWERLHNWYTERYLNPDSPERQTFDRATTQVKERF